MRTRTALIAILGLALSGCLGTPRMPRQPELRGLERALEATVKIETRDGGHGSGVIVSHEGHVLTALHVVMDGKGEWEEATVTLPDSRGFMRIHRLKVLAFNGENDLAIGQIDRKFDRPAVMEFEENIRSGDAVYNVGYLHDFGKMVGRGNIMRRHYDETGKNTIFTRDADLMDINSGPGDSGSAVFSERSGKVVGVLTHIYARPFSRHIPATKVVAVRNIRYAKNIMEAVRVPYLTSTLKEPVKYPKIRRSLND